MQDHGATVVTPKQERKGNNGHTILTLDVYRNGGLWGRGHTCPVILMNDRKDAVNPTGHRSTRKHLLKATCGYVGQELLIAKKEIHETHGTVG